MNYTFQWGPVWEAAPVLLSGALITLQLTVLCSIFGLIVGVFLALARRSTIVSARLVASAWIGIARNTPSLLQIFLAYFGLGAYGIHISPWWAVFVAVTWNTAGYMAEIIRGGFAAVNPRQRAAALSLGMSSFQSYRYVVLPQVLKAVFLPLMNQVVLTLLGTSLGMIIGLDDLAGVTTVLQSTYYRPFEFYFATAIVYYLLVKAIVVPTRIVGMRYFGKADRR